VTGEHLQLRGFSLPGLLIGLLYAAQAADDGALRALAVQVLGL
jgi:hypothetical protein